MSNVTHTDQAHILKVEALRIGYHDVAASKRAIYPPFSIQAAKSELIALIGRNGIGKSTLLRSLAGLQKPIEGSISLLDKPLSAYSRKELASLVSFVSAEPVRVVNLTVFDLVALGRFPYTGLFGGLSKVDEELVYEALAMVGLTDFTHRTIDRLSDGERQRAMIARSLAQNTQLIIFDEPTAFIDLPSKYEVVMLLRRLAHERGKTIIFSTHDLNIALHLSDKFWLMSPSGFKSGAPEDLAMQNAYDELFDTTELVFDSRTGDVQLAERSVREVAIVGNIDLFWATRAMERLGYHTNEQQIGSCPTLYVSEKNGQATFEWRESGENHLFTTLYELACYLRGKES